MNYQKIQPTTEPRKRKAKKLPVFVSEENIE